MRSSSFQRTGHTIQEHRRFRPLCRERGSPANYPLPHRCLTPRACSFTMTSQPPEGIVRWGVLMIVNCPQCQARLNIPEEAATKLVRCAKCWHTFRVHIEANAEPVPETRVA